MTESYTTPADVEAVLAVHERHPEIPLAELWPAWDTLRAAPVERADILDQIATRGRLGVAWQVYRSRPEWRGPDRPQEGARVLEAVVFRHAVPTLPRPYGLLDEVTAGLTLAADAVEPVVAPLPALAEHDERHRIGDVVGLDDDGERIKAWIRLAPRDLADDFLADHLLGYRVGVSAGFLHAGRHLIDIVTVGVRRTRLTEVSLTRQPGHPDAKVTRLVASVPADHELIVLSDHDRRLAASDLALGDRNPAYRAVLADADRQRIERYQRLIVRERIARRWHQAHGDRPVHVRQVGPDGILWSAPDGRVTGVR